MRISGLTRVFAECVGLLDLAVPVCSEDKSDSESSSSLESIDEEKKCEEKKHSEVKNSLRDEEGDKKMAGC